jgi:hypothetical protein
MSTDLVTTTAEPDASLGPAMALLTPLQQAWVQATIQYGANATEAASLAGYAGSRETLKARGWQLSRDAKVLAAVHEEAVKLLRSKGPMAIGVLSDLAVDPLTPPRDRIKAAGELLNRAGLAGQSEHKIIVEKREPTSEERVANIVSMCAKLGLDPRQVLGYSAPAELIHDAHFTNVSTAR